MSASERDATTRPHALPGPSEPSGISMRDLLASCVAASAVSTPPRDPAPRGGAATERRRPSC
ncbi:MULTISPECIES: hypothetical protein [unclassified Streptomyces]|uniref:hypothetical protein n=1 Tax=unclassified Streptomyces TaxID=2593676 RepID=UPI0033F252E8|nr:hypothetical protein OG302_17930 [Streptomyces sp. NBC_01283]